MSATDTLRANLSAAGIEYENYGDHYIIVESRGVRWAVRDNYDNKTMNVCNNRLTPDEMMRVITGRDAWT
jgi:hypothetical protein